MKEKKSAVGLSGGREQIIDHRGSGVLPRGGESGPGFEC